MSAFVGVSVSQLSKAVDTVYYASGHCNAGRWGGVFKKVAGSTDKCGSR